MNAPMSTPGSPGGRRHDRRRRWTELVAGLVTAVGAFMVTVSPAVAATSPACTAGPRFDPTIASVAALHACGLTRIALSDTKPLPGGGVLYEYDLPDGQVVSYPKTPPHFNGVTATAAEDAIYGLPPAPARTAPSYPAWARRAAAWKLDPGGSASVIASLGSGTRIRSAGGPKAHAAASNIWAGYIDTGSGWTRAEVDYTEPSLLATHCSGAQVSFWDGIGGYNHPDIAQDGTVSGTPGFQNHQAFFQAGPSGQFEFTNTNGVPVYVAPGSHVQAITHYLGNNNYQFIEYVNGQGYVAGGNTAYVGATTEEIVERASGAPLHNFSPVTLNGYNGRGRTPIADFSHIQTNMVGYATTGPLSGATFKVTQDNCAG